MLLIVILCVLYMAWDFSRYNVIVQQIEGVSDLLADCAQQVGPLVGNDKVAQLLFNHLVDASDSLGRRAFRMLALYDPAARRMWREGVRRDPRRPQRPTNPAKSSCPTMIGAASRFPVDPDIYWIWWRNEWRPAEWDGENWTLRGDQEEDGTVFSYTVPFNGTVREVTRPAVPPEGQKAFIGQG